MMVAVLLGALSLGACVDNDESASVEAVRNAKAEQLKGLAALANAQAEATKITAEAEAALKNAQAEYQKEMTEEAKQKFAVKIEQIKAKAEQDIAAAKLQAAQDQQALLDLADKRLRELYSQYSIAVGELNQYTGRKLNAVTELTALESGIVEKYEKVDKTELEQKAITLRKEYDKVNALVGPKETARYNANKAFEEASYRFNSYYYPEPNSNGENYVKDPIKTVASVKTFETKRWWNVYAQENKALSANKSVPYYTLNASGVESKKQELANT